MVRGGCAMHHEKFSSEPRLLQGRAKNSTNDEAIAMQIGCPEWKDLDRGQSRRDLDRIHVWCCSGARSAGRRGFS
jgi:hypothetical protein